MAVVSPILIVERVEFIGTHASAEVTIGGQQARVELDLSLPGFAGYERLPEALSGTSAAKNAVVGLVQRMHGGEKVHLPADLSDVVRGASEPWPLPTTREIASPTVPTTIARVDQDAPERGLVTVALRIGSDDAVVVVDPRGGLEQPLRFRFAAGAHPWQLSAEAAHAMLLALVAAVRH